MRRISVFAIWLSLSCCFPHATFAVENIDSSLNDDGFGDIDRLYNAMTADQKAAVLREAGIKMQELQKMSPEQQQKIFDQLKSVDKTLSVDKVNPEALDTSKTQSTDQTLQSLDSYQQKYSEGKIHNDVVNPAPQQ